MIHYPFPIKIEMICYSIKAPIHSSFIIIPLTCSISKRFNNGFSDSFHFNSRWIYNILPDCHFTHSWSYSSPWYRKNSSNFFVYSSFPILRYRMSSNPCLTIFLNILLATNLFIRFSWRNCFTSNTSYWDCTLILTIPKSVPQDVLECVCYYLAKASEDHIYIP